MQVELGSVVNGKITGITGFGAFVAIDGGGSGLIHISEIASEYVADINHHLSAGQRIAAKVVNIESNGKISLSIKKMSEGEKSAANPVIDGKPAGEKPSGGGKPFAESKPRGERRPPIPQNPAEMTFEDKLLKFKQDSDEKMQSLKRSSDGKRGSGGYRRTY